MTPCCWAASFQTANPPTPSQGLCVVSSVMPVLLQSKPALPTRGLGNHSGISCYSPWGAELAVSWGRDAHTSPVPKSTVRLSQQPLGCEGSPGMRTSRLYHHHICSRLGCGHGTGEAPSRGHAKSRDLQKILAQKIVPNKGLGKVVKPTDTQRTELDEGV